MKRGASANEGEQGEQDFGDDQGVGVHNHIWEDSRRSDRKYGRENDLTKEFIAEQIAKGCSYCGEDADDLPEYA